MAGVIQEGKQVPGQVAYGSVTPYPSRVAASSGCSQDTVGEANEAATSSSSVNRPECAIDCQGFPSIRYQCPAGQRAIYRMTTVENGLTLHRYWPSACPRCSLKARCTPGVYRRVTRWEHEAILETMQRRLDRKPEAMTLRRRTIEHVFGTLKHWMGSTHFLTRGLRRVGTETALHVLAYNFKRVIKLLGMARTMRAMRLAGT